MAALMFPREHGAYGQMAMPIVATWAIAGLSAPAVLLSVAVAAAFVAHEPLLVRLGRRGTRAKREEGRRAAIWLVLTAGAAATTGLLGAWGMPGGARWTLALPALPAVALGAAILVHRHTGTAAQVAAALAFSLTAVPVAAASGAPPRVGWAVATVFGSVFVAATLAVRGVVVGTRGGGDPRAARTLRTAAALFAAAASVGLAGAASRGVLPWAALAAAVPALTATLWLVSSPPAPTRRRTVGWTLVAVSALAMLVLIAAL